MEYKLVGFGHNGSVRLFSFLAITEDRTQTLMTVSADLTLARQFAVKVQDLPMLCKRILQQRSDESCSLPISITADHMRLYSKEDAAAAGLHGRKSGKARETSAAPPTTGNPEYPASDEQSPAESLLLGGSVVSS